MSKSNTELGVTEQFRDNFPQILSKCIWGRHQLELPEQVNSTVIHTHNICLHGNMLKIILKYVLLYITENSDLTAFAVCPHNELLAL